MAKIAEGGESTAMTEFPYPFYRGHMFGYPSVTNKPIKELTSAELVDALSAAVEFQFTEHYMPKPAYDEHECRAELLRRLP